MKLYPFEVVPTDELKITVRGETVMFHVKVSEPIVVDGLDYSKEDGLKINFHKDDE
jgi:hypothetical protein